MEVNKPDQGIMKGMGKLQMQKFMNRKFFPNLRNQHRFQFTHQHRNQYKTSFSSFNKEINPRQYHFQKIKKIPNQSQIVLGNGSLKVPSSWNKSVFKKNDYSLPPKPIKQEDQGIGINQYQKLTGQKIKYSTTSHDIFSTFNKKDPKADVKYKYTRTDRFNPITGESVANTSFGFEDHVPSNEKKYKANNHTLIPFHGGKYDIISGRKITYG